MEFLRLSEWGEDFEERPFLIAGPCSAESEEQLMQTAMAIREAGIHYFRAGVWKPRTRPGSYEGAGKPALAWLSDVKNQTGLRVIVEVANPDHVEAALQFGIDAVWIGARTTVNPFNVQAIADALERVDIPVFVKNPVNPDLNLWIGALERISKAGIRRLAAIHRGFSYYTPSRFRNHPMWEIPIELKRLFPHLPLICDPSHICGNTILIQDICQKALDLQYEGLMIETHINPASALSDPDQQVTPDQLLMLLENLVIRNAGPTDKRFNLTLAELRDIIDRLDEELIEILARRIEVIHQIGMFKKENNIAILQPERWNQIVKTRLAWADNARISRQFILDLFRQIHQESIRLQTDIMKGDGETGHNSPFHDSYTKVANS